MLNTMFFNLKITFVLVMLSSVQIKIPAKVTESLEQTENPFGSYIKFSLIEKKLKKIHICIIQLHSLQRAVPVSVHLSQPNSQVAR